MPKTDHPRPVSAERLERLDAWARRKPRIALMGEFSSGKSTLLNLLVGEELLPTRVTATELPPVWFSHGEPRAYWVDRAGRRHALDFGEFDGVPRSARYVRAFTPAPMLERCDIIDTPGISDPNLDDESWRFPVGQANFVLWCTPATQAWRETERSTWLSLPERLRANSVLVVTRADKLVRQGDQEKVHRRLSRESFGLFGNLVFLSSPDAMQGQALLEQCGDDSLWVRSGGAELESKLDHGLGAVRAARLDLLDRYVSTGPATVGLVPPARATADGLPLRLIASAEPVRPRRVERTDTPKTQRPAPDSGADPLNEIRAGWLALRSGEEAQEAAPVLRLMNPVTEGEAPRAAPPRAEPPAAAPFAEDWSWATRAKVRDPDSDAPATGQPDLPQAESDSPDAADAARVQPEAPPAGQAETPASAADAENASAIEAVLASLGQPEPEPEASEEPEPVAAAAQSGGDTLPRAVRLWREIIDRYPEMPENRQILDMIDHLLLELSRNDQPSDGTGLIQATPVARHRAA